VTLALHNYHDTHGQLPPAVVYGDYGQPLYSWRVLILPFIEHEEQFNEFHLDEPWDSPHNLTLLPKMPRTYALPPHSASKMKLPPYHTIMHVFVGRDAAFEGKVGLRMRDFTDGLSNTILVIEAGEPVPWTKPEDLYYDPDEPLPDLRCPFRNGFRVGLGDGGVRTIGKRMSEKTLRAAITRNGGERLGPDWQEY
jgi:hypothetical protein